MAIFNYNNDAIFYQIDGDGNKPHLLLLNGIMMSTKSWDSFVQPLTDHFTLLRVDLYDQGQSTKKTDYYTQSIQVDLIKALLDELKIKKLHITGISYGGSIALQFATKHQEMIDKMIVLNAVAKTSKWLKAIGDGWNEVAKTRNGLAYYHITIPFIYSPMFYNFNHEWMENRKKLLIPIFSNEVFLDAMIRLTVSAETHDVTSSLSNIKTKTLIVSSDEDYLTPPFEQTYLKNALPNAQMITFHECGHASMYEKPQLFVSTIIGFLSEKVWDYNL
ncbi:alpha/beta fold hydrolase [Liberiplasma polymorphum]|jgi:3-oxoadipate enol-lactonase|uniref:alpha/beta fold hydrolase n=1 Tax=Liberiplasma polymorphum TaxID=3374570 RepID=UPI0037719D29